MPIDDLGENTCIHLGNHAGLSEGEAPNGILSTVIARSTTSSAQSCSTWKIPDCRPTRARLWPSGPASPLTSHLTPLAGPTMQVFAGSAADGIIPSVCAQIGMR